MSQRTCARLSERMSAFRALSPPALLPTSSTSVVKTTRTKGTNSRVNAGDSHNSSVTLSAVTDTAQPVRGEASSTQTPATGGSDALRRQQDVSIAASSETGSEQSYGDVSQAIDDETDAAARAAASPTSTGAIAHSPASCTPRSNDEDSHSPTSVGGEAFDNGLEGGSGESTPQAPRRSAITIDGDSPLPTALNFSTPFAATTCGGATSPISISSSSPESTPSGEVSVAAHSPAISVSSGGSSGSRTSADEEFSRQTLSAFGSMYAFVLSMLNCARRNRWSMIGTRASAWWQRNGHLPFESLPNGELRALWAAWSEDDSTGHNARVSVSRFACDVIALGGSVPRVNCGAGISSSIFTYLHNTQMGVLYETVGAGDAQHPLLGACVTVPVIPAKEVGVKIECRVIKATVTSLSLSQATPLIPRKIVLRLLVAPSANASAATLTSLTALPSSTKGYDGLTFVARSGAGVLLEYRATLPIADEQVAVDSVLDAVANKHSFEFVAPFAASESVDMRRDQQSGSSHGGQSMQCLEMSLASGVLRARFDIPNTWQISSSDLGLCSAALRAAAKQAASSAAHWLSELRVLADVQHTNESTVVNIEGHALTLSKEQMRILVQVFVSFVLQLSPTVHEELLQSLRVDLLPWCSDDAITLGEWTWHAIVQTIRDPAVLQSFELLATVWDHSFPSSSHLAASSPTAAGYAVVSSLMHAQKRHLLQVQQDEMGEESSMQISTKALIDAGISNAAVLTLKGDHAHVREVHPGMGRCLPYALLLHGGGSGAVLPEGALRPPPGVRFHFEGMRHIDTSRFDMTPMSDDQKARVERTLLAHADLSRLAHNDALPSAVQSNPGSGAHTLNFRAAAGASLNAGISIESIARASSAVSSIGAAAALTSAPATTSVTTSGKALPVAALASANSYASKAVSRSVKTCFNCGAPNHLSQSCLLPPGNKLCYNCMQPGHQRRQCTNRTSAQAPASTSASLSTPASAPAASASASHQSSYLQMAQVNALASAGTASTSLPTSGATACTASNAPLASSTETLVAGAHLQRCAGRGYASCPKSNWAKRNATMCTNCQKAAASRPTGLSGASAAAAGTSGASAIAPVSAGSADGFQQQGRPGKRQKAATLALWVSLTAQALEISADAATKVKAAQLLNGDPAWVQKALESRGKFCILGSVCTTTKCVQNKVHFVKPPPPVAAPVTIPDLAQPRVAVASHAAAVPHDVTAPHEAAAPPAVENGLDAQQPEQPRPHQPQPSQPPASSAVEPLVVSALEFSAMRQDLASMMSFMKTLMTQQQQQHPAARAVQLSTAAPSIIENLDEDAETAAFAPAFAPTAIFRGRSGGRGGSLMREGMPAVRGGRGGIERGSLAGGCVTEFAAAPEPAPVATALADDAAASPPTSSQ